MLPVDFIPQKPFPTFKWRWASKECTEGLNDPLILLGVLYRLYKLDNKGLTYSSQEFAKEMESLEMEVRKNVNFKVNLSSRVGERNLMRNSKQYWTSLGLVDNAPKGLIMLTDFGREIARHNISQAEFAAITIQTQSLPNPATMTQEECARWNEAGIKLYPLKLLLQIIRALYLKNTSEAYITRNELCEVIIPLSGTRDAQVDDYVAFISSYRKNKDVFCKWPDCCTGANDKRIAREYLLFLNNYGYLKCIRKDGQSNATEQYQYNYYLDKEIENIISGKSKDVTLNDAWNCMKMDSSSVSELERKRIKASYNRPNQAKFRHDILSTYKRCIITNVEMAEVLEAAHIVPFAYHGEDSIANGIPLRSDIHILFDTGNLRISSDGDVVLSDKARYNYGMSIPRQIVIPPQINKDFIKWRWENYSGL